MSSVSSKLMKMENLLTTYEFHFWTDDFILPNIINLKNSSSCTDPFFMIQLRIQQFVEYLSEEGDSMVEEPRGPFMVESFYLPSDAVTGGDDKSIREILSCVGVPQHRMPAVIQDMSDFGRRMLSQPAIFGRPLLPIVIGIEVNTCDPTEAEIAHQIKYGWRPEIEEEDKPVAKRQRIEV